MHQAPIAVDYCTNYEQIQPILLGDMATNMQHMVPKIPNMNKITTFLSAYITTNTQNL